jgi:uncharacterized protein (TIGR02246 family)
MNAPLNTEQRQAIVDVLVAYSWAIDTGDTEGVADLFAPQGQFCGADGTISRGRDQLLAFADRVHRSRPYRLQHVTSNPVYEVIEPGRVRVRSYVHIFAGEPGGPRLLGMGAYDDLLVHSAGQWRFESRRYESWGGGAS